MGSVQEKHTGCWLHTRKQTWDPKLGAWLVYTCFSFFKWVFQVPNLFFGSVAIPVPTVVGFLGGIAGRTAQVSYKTGKPNWPGGRLQ